MNDLELQGELARNESEKQLIRAELDSSHKKWVEYALKNKDEICSIHHPIVVKKKRSARWKDFINKLKAIFGLTKRKENYDGIEAYLQYRDNCE